MVGGKFLEISPTRLNPRVTKHYLFPKCEGWGQKLPIGQKFTNSAQPGKIPPTPTIDSPNQMGGLPKINPPIN